ncbi:ABC transporter, ATP-binding protein [Ancylostoma ceylanicum]|uniref:ABC transporter, ATP-binding protein n=1 Tax=Ancylostoma ceylanicum TaxID=53326 RepID=A0A0D6L3Q6_9BILA|nr:ABC transporter, ATP-binding protein [Ancylostoma ceylanicum]
MRAADEILDIGPMAGVYGGEVVFQGTHKELVKANSITADYLTGKRKIPVPDQRRKQKNALQFSGVSGSGKSTLIKDIVYPAVRNKLGEISLATQNFETEGDWKMIKAVELVDQNPIGKSSRSNPVTYVKAFDEIRELYAKQPLAKARGYKPGFFSFNVEGGRCEMCEGEGKITVGMQFMADIHLTCETCNGTRYKAETLEVEYKGVNISQMLEMDIESALAFFKENNGKLEEKIVEKIQPLFDVGLGYLKLGQSSSTMSGGEAQRIKLASFLAKGSEVPSTLFIFDEPTTGLHFYDIDKLIIAFNRLIDTGHSVLVIEHNGEVIKCADWVIDLGPEGGINGGQIVFTGTPEDLVKCKESYTGQYLKLK